MLTRLTTTASHVETLARRVLPSQELHALCNHRGNGGWHIGVARGRAGSTSANSACSASSYTEA